jgi:hypothetical protein
MRKKWDKQVEYNKKRRLRIRLKVIEYLKCNPCVDCGESDPIVLQFDHVEAETKILSISEMLSRDMAWKAIWEEIEKCVVRCANCHQRRTAKQFNWYKLFSVTQ